MTHHTNGFQNRHWNTGKCGRCESWQVLGLTDTQLQVTIAKPHSLPHSCIISNFIDAVVCLLPVDVFHIVFSWDLKEFILGIMSLGDSHYHSELQFEETARAFPPQQRKVWETEVR